MLKTDGTTVSFTALPEGKVKVNCMGFDEPKTMLKGGEVFQVPLGREDAAAAAAQAGQRAGQAVTASRLGELVGEEALGSDLKRVAPAAVRGRRALRRNSVDSRPRYASSSVSEINASAAHSTALKSSRSFGSR